MPLEGKTALITGGTRGIGRAVAARLAQSGHVVSVIGRSTPAKPDANVRVWTADVADPGRLAAVLEEIGREQGKVSGAVLSQRFRGDGDDWAGEIATSLAATRQVIEWVGGHAEPRGQGPAIVVVGSTAASLVASEQPVGYHMAKAAVMQMVRYYAVALGPKGIRVNAVSPGTTVKDESKQFYADSDAAGADLFEDLRRRNERRAGFARVRPYGRDDLRGISAKSQRRHQRRFGQSG